MTNISKNVTPQKLREFFEFCGAIVSMKINEAKNATDTTEALILFSNPVSANTATMLTNARLDANVIKVEYFFDEYKNITANAQSITAGPDSREQKASNMVSQWLASGLLLTEQLVESGKNSLRQYGLLERIEGAFDGLTKKATEVDEKYKLREKVHEYEMKYKVVETFNSYLNQAASVYHDATEKYPVVKQANDLVQKGFEVGQATFEETKSLYAQKKAGQKPFTEIPVD